MKKKIKDMTNAEKAMRIKHLSYKFYDSETTPSTILYTEIQYAEPDKYINQMLKNLEILESNRFKLQDRYSKILATTIPQFKRKFEYEIQKLIERQKSEVTPRKFDPMRKHTKCTIEEKHEQELAELKRSQLIRKKKLEDAAKLELDAWNDQLYNTFMNTVRYLYR